VLSKGLIATKTTIAGKIYHEKQNTFQKLFYACLRLLTASPPKSRSKTVPGSGVVGSHENHTCKKWVYVSGNWGLQNKAIEFMFVLPGL